MPRYWMSSRHPMDQRLLNKLLTYHINNNRRGTILIKHLVSWMFLKSWKCPVARHSFIAVSCYIWPSISSLEHFLLFDIEHRIIMMREFWSVWYTFNRHSETLIPQTCLFAVPEIENLRSSGIINRFRQFRSSVNSFDNIVQKSYKGRSN